MKRALILLVASVLALAPSVALAAPNTGTGDINGVDGDLTNSSVFNLSAVTLGLIKTAFLSDGTELGDGDSVPSGTTVHFLIYVNNSTAVPVDDVTIQDTLNAAFTYTATSIRVDNSESCALAVCDNTEEGDIFTAVLAQTPLSDTPGNDVGSYDTPTTTVDVGDGNEITNAQVDILANRVYAVLVTVTVV
jgi:uncharacterized repeat protein (TIGR01451 family)